MATDKISVDLLLNTRRADRELARLNKEFAKLGKTMGGSFGGPGKGGDKVRALGSGLSKATVKADEFTKSLEASNARVVAFGASAGIIMQIDRAFKGLVTSTMKVEKALLDVNVVLNATNKNLKKFGEGMFQISRQTAQGFETVAEAATELARQGLGMEQTLGRTKDALILTRLTGMGAADAVKTLTAAVNSFNKEGVTSAEIINRMAKVDAAFAVSSEDLAKSISRVGASAVSAGVNMNELMAITTAVQQKTARGGAVIGNAFKTIFTRIQRSDVLQKLRNIGVAVTDMNGNMLSGMQVLQNLAGNFDKLSKSQQSSVSESVAGVFQVNILKAAMSDLSSQTSNYSRALQTANSATNEAYQRNEQLNQSLDAMSNKALANLTQAGASLGGGTLEPAIKRVLDILNTSIESFGKGGVMEGFGQTWGKGIMKGLGDFIAGPGLVLVVATIGKLFYNLTKFTGKAFADIMGINKAAQQRVTIEGAIVDTLAKEPALLSSILSGDTKILSVEQQILATIRKQNIERQAMQAIAAPVAGALMGRGLHVGRSGGMSFKGGGRAGGFVPNFANAGSERAAAAAGGYQAGSVRTMNQPGAGTMMYNSAETVKRFPGMSQSAIMPPQGSPAGAGYKSAFGAAHGFDPYAAAGFVPNFAAIPGLMRMNKGKSGEMTRGASMYGKGKKPNSKAAKDRAYKMGGDLSIAGGMGGGISMLVPDGLPKEVGSFIKGTGTYKNFRASIPIRSYDKDFLAEKLPKGPKDIIARMKSAAAGVTMKFAHSIDPPARDITRPEVEAALDSTKGAKGALTAAAGAGFEVGMNLALDVKAAAEETKIGDFDLRGTQAEKTHRIFGGVYGIADYKASRSGHNRGSMTNKMAKELVEGGKGSQFILHKPKKDPNAATLKKFGPRGLGFVPNFSPLTSAVGREMAAGVPASAIRVGSSGSLKSSGNPGGVGVYNTIHEPGGLQQGISRSRAGGINPKSHGVPNFAGEGLILPDPVIPGWKLREAARAKAASDAYIRTKNLEIAATARATKQTGMFGRMMGGLSGKSTGIGMGLGLIVPSIVNTMTQGSEPGSTGARAGSAASQAAMWGGTGMMVHPLVGLAGAIGGGLFGYFTSAVDDASTSVEALTKKMTELAQKEDRTVETFERIAQEMDKVNKTKFASERTGGLAEQRNKLVDYLTETYGKKTASGNIRVLSGSELEKDISEVSGATTGEDMRKIATRIAKRGKSRTATSRLETILADESINTKRGGIAFRDAQGKAQFADSESQEFHRLMMNRGFDPSKQLKDKEGWDVPVLGDVFGWGWASDVGERKAGSQRSLIGSASKITGSTGRKSGLSLIEEAYLGTGKSKTIDIEGRKIKTQVHDMDAATEVLEGKRAALAYALSPKAGMEEGALRPDGTPYGKYDLVAGVHRRATAEEVAGGIAGVSGIDDQDKAKFIEALLKQAKTVAASRRESGIEGFAGETAVDVLDELGNELLDAGMKASDLGKLHDILSQKEAARLEQIKKEIIEYERSLKLFRAQTKLLLGFGSALRLASLQAKHNLALGKQQEAFTKQRFGIQQRGALSNARSVMDPFGVTGVTRTQSLQKAGSDNMASRAAAARQAQFGAGEAGRKVLQDAMKDITKALLENDTGVTVDVLRAKRESLETMGLRGLGDQSIDELRATLAAQTKTLADIEGKAGLLGSAQAAPLSEIEKTQLKALQKSVPAIEKVIKSYENSVDLADVKLKQQKEIADKTLEVQQQEIRNRMVFNSQMRDFNQLVAYMLAQQEGADATGLAKTGRISGQTMVGRYKNAVETRRNRFGLGNMDKEAGESFSLGLKGAMTYGARDYLDELEDGSRQVATTMKTSFADAFKSIASGASSAQEAMAQFAGNILNTISDMSAQMATNMLFSRMGFPTKAKGGYIPRYGGGGVVTGGSGMKDDVLSMMNGGEYVIKKSSAKKIGYDTLNAINSGGVGGFAEGGAQKGGGNMGKMFAVSAAASAASGLVSGQWGKSKKKPWRGQDYGHGRGEHGYFGGPDSDARGADSIAGGGRGAQVSLNKAYVYYRRDPETGKLVSERVRPTEGKYEVSGALSLLGRLNADDRQTGRMFGKEQKMGAYSDYLFTETENRKDIMKAHKKQKRGRLISAYMNAAMLIGGSYMMGKTGPAAGKGGSGFTMDKVGSTGMPDWALAGGEIPASSYGAHFGPNAGAFETGDSSIRGVNNEWKDPWKGAAGGSVGGSPALLTGGEFVMGADTVRQYGLDFMGELNRGGVPGMAAGGPVSRGNQGAIAGMVAGGETNNNVNISINVDKRGNVEAQATQGTNTQDNTNQENTVKDAENNKDLGKALQTVVLQELIRQQRPGGLLQKS